MAGQYIGTDSYDLHREDLLIWKLFRICLRRLSELCWCIEKGLSFAKVPFPPYEDVIGFEITI